MSDMLKVYCACGALLGTFGPLDDNGGIIMLCPSCHKDVEIDNAGLLEVLDNPEDYEPNDSITVTPFETEEDT